MNPPRDRFDTPAGCPGPRPDPSSDVAVEDWDVLFDAVVERLRAAFENSHPRVAAHRRQAWSQARSHVLECVVALDQLHLTATHDFARHRGDDADGQPPEACSSVTSSPELVPAIRDDVVRASTPTVWPRVSMVV